VTGGECRACTSQGECLPAWLEKGPACKMARMKTLDDMRHRMLLSADQHARIAAWVASSDGPDAIMAMPADLWRALSLASLLMNIDADLTQPPHLGF
jgi:hypothetical protein